MIPEEASILQQRVSVTETFTPGLEETINEDGILCNILSSLTLAEAVRTSALSSRWRHLWPTLTKFNFDAINVLDCHTLRECDLDTIQSFNLTKGKTDKFIQAVDSVIQQFRGDRVDEFTVHHFLDKKHSHHIDAWIRFAVANKTKVLCLQLLRSYSTPTNLYDFPCQLLSSSSLSSYLESLILMTCSIKMPLNFNGLSHLKKLILADIDVSQEDFHCILHNCSSTISKICLWLVHGWESISIPHPLNQLHTLLVKRCHLRKLEVNAVNLVEVIYEGVPLDFRFRQSPMLTDADICFKIGGSVHNLDFYLTNLASSLRHLRSLQLKISGDSKVDDLPKGSSTFNHLTSLDFEWNVGVKMSLLHLATLLDAAPILKNLKLHLSTQVEEQPPQIPSKLMQMLPTEPRTHLKTAKVSGFYFDIWQVEIVVYLLKRATELESLSIEKGSRFISEETYETGINNLNKEVPPNAKFEIV